MVSRHSQERLKICRSALQSLSRSALRNLNDHVVEAYIVVRALSAVQAQMEKGTLFPEKKINISVPSSPRKRAGIQRSRQQFSEMVSIGSEVGPRIGIQ